MSIRVRVVAAAMVVGLVGIGACSRIAGDDAGGDSQASRSLLPSSDEGAANAAKLHTASAAATGSAGGAASAPADGAGSVADTATNAAAPLPQGIGAPKVIKTAVIEIEVGEGRFDAAFTKVPSIAAALGGFVASSTSTSSQAGDGETDETRQAAGSAVLRVPADQFEAARTELLKLGELRSQQVEGEDVSAQLTDLDARLRNLRSQEEAIRLLMTRAKTIGETIEVQRQLGSVREQIEQLAAEQARLGDAVALSTLTVNLAEPGAAARIESEPSPLAEAVREALRGAQNVLAGTIVTLGYLLPLALLLAAGWMIARPIRTRLSST